MQGRLRRKINSNMQGRLRRKIDSNIQGHLRRTTDSNIRGLLRRKTDSNIQGHLRRKIDSNIQGHLRRNTDSNIQGLLRWVEDIFQYARSSEVEDRFQYARSSEAEHRFQYPKSSEAEDRFQYPRSSEVEDRFQYHRTSEAEDRFPYPKLSEAEDRFPYLRTLEWKGRLSHPKSSKVKERSPINQTQVDIETCVVRETIYEVSPTLKNYQSPKSENMTEECVEMNKELVSRSQELWTQKPTNTNSPNIGLQRKDENNNDFIPFDSLTDNKYEYITTDDFLYTEPLNLCIKQPNSTIGVEKSDDKVRRPAVPTTIDNSNFSKAPSFSEDCAVPMSPVYGSHTVAAAKGTLSHTDQVTTRENKGFFYGNQYYIRSGPKQKEFDENANCIEDPHAFSRLEGSSTVTRLEDTNAASIPVGSTATGFDGPNTATQAGFPLTVSRPEDLPAATLQYTYPYTRCESLNTTKGVGGQFTHTRSEDSSRERETYKQNPNKIIVKFNVPRHLDEGKLTNRKLEKIQTIFRSDGAVDQQGSRSTCDEMDKDGTPDKAAGRPNSEVTRESQAMSREKFPNIRNSLNTVGNTGPEPHEKMLMHMMYTQHLLGTDGNGNMCSKPQEPSGRMLQCALDSGDIQKPQEPSGRMLQTALDLGDIHKPQEPSGRRLQCSYPVEDHQQYNSVPLDLSCNKYRSTPAASVRVPVHHLHPKFESSIAGVRPMSDTFVPGIQKEVESFKSNIWPRCGIVNEVPHVRKLNSDNFMSAGVLTNLRMPDNVEELLCQRAVPRPGCIAYPLPPRRLLLNPPYSRVAGVGTEAWKAATYQHVPDTNPSAACRPYTNRTFAAPGPVQLQDCMANMFGNNIEFDNGNDTVRKNLSMKQRSDTTKSYKLLSQMLDGGDGASETNKKTQTRDCPTPSVKSGTFCTNFHVHPIPQTFPAAAHRHFIPASSEAHSHSQPPNLLGISSVLQQCGSDVIQRKNTPEISHQLPFASTRGLFRPYMNENETLTKTMTNSGPRNSEVVCPPRKMLSEDVRKTLGRHLIGRASTKKMFTSSNGNPDPQPESSDDRAYFPPAGNAGNMQKFRISEGNVSNLTMSYLEQINFEGDEGNIFRHPNDNNGNLFHGNQRQGLDCNKTAHALAEPRMISVKFPHEPGLSRVSHINGKNVFPENRNEDSSCNGNDRGMPHRQYVEYTVASPDPANIVEFADKSLAVAQGLSDRPPIDQNSHNWDTVYKNFCCKCWSRGKCRSCVCSKIGCHNCRNPLCQFLNVTNPKKALSRHKKVKGKSCTRSKSRITKQPTSPEYRSQASAELVDRTHRQTGYSQNTSEVCELSGPMGTGTRVNEVLRGSGLTEQGTLMDYKLAEGRNDLPDFMEKIESVVEDETEVSDGLDDMVVKQNEVVEELSGKNDLDSAIHEREKSEQKLAFDQRILLEAKTTVDKNYWRSLHAFDKEMSDNEHKIITQAKVSQKQTTAEGSHMDQSFSCKTQFDAIPSSAVLPPERVASGSVKSKSEGVTKGIIDKTSKIKFKNKKDKGKKNRTNVKKKSTSNSFVHKSLDRNNNVGNDCTQTLKRMHNNDDIENEVSDVTIPKLSRSSNDTPEHVDENNNVNSLESNSLRNDIDANNNDTCFPKSGTASTSSEISTEHELVRTTTKMKKSCYQSKRRITKIKKGSVENVKRTITGEGQSFNEDIDNAMETASAATLDKEYKTPPKKGRPRTRPPPKQLPPKMLIKLEEHTDKYEVTQFTSFHKKDRNIEVGLKSFERFTCRLCSGMYQYNTPDRASMEDHLAQHLSGRLTCPDCGKTFSQAIHVREHRQKIHRTADFTCEICAKQFFTNTTLKRHLCKAHGHKLFNCKQCTERFSSVEQVKNHVYEVHGGEATKCEKCGVISLSSKAAAVHAKSKMCLGREESNVPCPHCSQILSVSQMAHHVKRIHLRVHTYKCSQCPYTTLARTALNNHMMMHQGVHPFRCELCPFSCVKSYQLSSHMRTHTGVKPYRCDQCSYAAAWNVQLKDHMRAHVSPNSVLCDECGILFKDDRCLNLHNKKIHKSKEEVKVAKYRKVKEKGTRRRRLKAAKEVKDEQPSNLDSVDTQKENSVLSCQEGQAVRQYDGAL
ncbi:uncharacterized protein [Argopecten irradians]|uniref:uncharacterized protein n=1 Tax=Argopecten irradians TaxID=31199 RepID=UPI003720E61A